MKSQDPLFSLHSRRFTVVQHKLVIMHLKKFLNLTLNACVADYIIITLS